MLIYFEFLANISSIGSYIAIIAFPYTNKKQLVEPGFLKGSYKLSDQT
jgi:hypothetical protein